MNRLGQWAQRKERKGSGSAPKDPPAETHEETNNNTSPPNPTSIPEEEKEEYGDGEKKNYARLSTTVRQKPVKRAKVSGGFRRSISERFNQLVDGAGNILIVGDGGKREEEEPVKKKKPKKKSKHLLDLAGSPGKLIPQITREMLAIEHPEEIRRVDASCNRLTKYREH